MQIDAIKDKLIHCKPLAMKLASQGYEYSFDSADLEYIALIEPVYEYFFATDEADKEATLITDSGLSEQEFLWLMVFYEMREKLQEYSQPQADSSYKPFKERLDFLIESEDVKTLHTRNRVPDPEHLVLVKLAQLDPFYLSITEKRLMINLTHKPGQPRPSLFTPRDRQTLNEFRKRTEQEDMSVLLPPDFFRKKR